MYEAAPIGKAFFKSMATHLDNINVKRDTKWSNSGASNRSLQTSTKPFTNMRVIVHGIIERPALESCDDYNKWELDVKVKNRDIKKLKAIMATGGPAKKKDYKTPFGEGRMIRFAAKLKDHTEYIDLNQYSAFPHLWDGRSMSPGNPEAEHFPVEEFLKDTSVAVELTITSYDFSNERGSRYGYTFVMDDVYYLAEHDSDYDTSDEEADNENDASTVFVTPKKRRIEEERYAPAKRTMMYKAATPRTK